MKIAIPPPSALGESRLAQSAGAQPLKQQRLKGLVRPRHFKDCYYTALVDGALRFEVEVDPQLREDELLADSQPDATHLEAFPATKIVLNPPDMPLDLARWLTKSAEPDTPRSKPRVHEVFEPWSVEDAFTEWQSATLIAYRGTAVVGYLDGHIWLNSPEHKRSFSLWFGLEYAWCAKTQRGTGVGLDLGIAFGLLAADVLSAAHAAVPARSKLDVQVNADWVSEGGQRMTEQVVTALEVRADQLREVARRPSVEIMDVVMDAGY